MRIYKQLTFTDRLRIEKMLKEKKSKREIADVLRVHFTTIYREIKRGQYEHLNSDYTTELRYSPDIAQKRYEESLRAKGPGLKIGKDHELATFLEEMIADKHYSPDAALGEIKRRGLKFSTTICRVTLYNSIDKGVFLRLTNKDLPRQGEKKEKHREVRAARPPRGESIEKRPNEVNDRSVFGHWEGDSVVGRKGSKKTLFCLTERVTRKELVFHLPDKTAASVVRALDTLEHKFGDLFPRLFKSITFDNGCEFSDCAGIERSSLREGEQRTKAYYCHPYSSYERGSNENQNGMLRRPFPKGTSFDEVTSEQVAAAEDWLNNYPRAMFDYKSSNDLFQECLCTLS